MYKAFCLDVYCIYQSSAKLIEHDLNRCCTLKKNYFLKHLAICNKKKYCHHIGYQTFTF